MGASWCIVKSVLVRAQSAIRTRARHEAVVQSLAATGLMHQPSRIIGSMEQRRHLKG